MAPAHPAADSVNVFGGPLNIRAMLGPIFPCGTVFGIGVGYACFRWEGLVWNLSDVREAANDAS